MPILVFSLAQNGKAQRLAFPAYDCFHSISSKYGSLSVYYWWRFRYRTCVSILCLAVAMQYIIYINYSKTCLKRPLKKEDQILVFKTNLCLMQVKSFAEWSKREHSAILSTFIKLPVVFKIIVLSIFE